MLMKVQELPSIPLNKALLRYREKLIATKGSEDAADKVFPPHRWHMLAYVHQRAKKGDSFLEIGYTNGYLLRALKYSKKFERFTLLDTDSHPSFENIEVLIGKIGDGLVDDQTYDCIFVSKTLEYLDDDELDATLTRIRAMARHQALFAVPYAEPETATGRRQRFDLERVQQVFPDAKLSLLLRPGRQPFIVAEELFD